MTGTCKMSGKSVQLPCSACGCPLFWDCYSEYALAAIGQRPTNADRIRGMSDEEMANQLCDLAYNRWYNGVFDDGNEGKRLLDWIRQPAEEGTT